MRGERFLSRLPGPTFFLVLGGAVAATGINYVSTLGLGGVEHSAGLVVVDAALWLMAGLTLSLLGQTLQEAKDGALRVGGATFGAAEVRALERDQLSRRGRRVWTLLVGAVAAVMASVFVAVWIYRSQPDRQAPVKCITESVSVATDGDPMDTPPPSGNC